MLFEWNEKVYEQMEKMLNEEKRCCLILGTCIGKTTTSLEYLIRNNVKGLVLVPNKTILENWSIYDNVDVMTYQKFAKEYKKIDYSKYGLLICDEVHHVGAKTWGEGVIHCLNNKLIKVLGLTATNVRSDKIDVADYIFCENKISGLSLYDGLKNKVLNPIKYVNAYYDLKLFKETLKRVKGQNKTLERKLNLEINNTPSVKKILLENMPNRKPKGIIFVSDFNDLDMAISIVKEAYPNCEFRKIHSKLDDNEENRKWFANVKEGFIVSVNMINEGSHYEGTNTVIMFRKTQSQLLYSQQIGRVISLHIHNNPEGIIFDLVNNNKTVSLLNSILGMGTINGSKISEKEKEEKIKELGEQLITRSYVTSLDDVMKEINDFLNDKWEEWEEDIIRKYYATEGPKGCQKRINDRWREIANGK